MSGDEQEQNRLEKTSHDPISSFILLADKNQKIVIPHQIFKNMYLYISYSYKLTDVQPPILIPL